MVAGIGVTRFLKTVERIRRKVRGAKDWLPQLLHFEALYALGIAEPNPTNEQDLEYAEALEVASRKQILGTARSILARRQAA